MFIELEVRTAIIIHGYDANHQEIEEKVAPAEFMKKLIALNRIKSISEQYLLVTSSHDRLMYWEYKGSMEDLKQKLLAMNVLIG
jgi:hypothetical protein